MSGRGRWILRNLPCQLIDDLRYNSLSVFVSQRFDKGLTDYRVRLPGVSGTGWSLLVASERPRTAHRRPRTLVNVTETAANRASVLDGYRCRFGSCG